MTDCHRKEVREDIIKMKYSMFIGRWQTWHDGHQWLIDQRLKEGKNVCIAVREVLSNENNPRPSWEVVGDLRRRFLHDKRVKIILIPDIESINYGRDVGYEVIEHAPPQEIKEISGTEIRNK